MGQSFNKEKERYNYEFKYELINSPNGFYEKFSPYDYTFNQDFPDQLRGIVNEDEYIKIGNYIKVMGGDGAPHSQYIQMVPLLIINIIYILFITSGYNPNKVSLSFSIAYFILAILLSPHAIMKIIKARRIKKTFADSIKSKGVEVGLVPKFRGYLMAYFTLIYIQAILVTFLSFTFYYSRSIILDIKLFMAALLFANFIILLFCLFNIVLFSKYRTYLSCTSYSTQYENQFTRVLTENIERYFKPTIFALFYNKSSTQQQQQQQQQPENQQQIEIEINTFDKINNNNNNNNSNNNYTSNSTIFTTYSNIDIDSEQSQLLINNDNRV